jgi:DNA-directed RNA polymerase subunit L
LKLLIEKNEDDRLELAFGGEGHTLLNLLQSFLLKNKDVEMTGYRKPHPLMDRSLLFMDMKKGKNPIEALLRSAEDAKEELNKFLKQFEDEVAKKG